MFVNSIAPPLRIITTSCDVKAPPDCVLSNINYEYLLIEYVVAGKGFVEIEDERHECATGDIYILPPGQNHRYGSLALDPWEKMFFICEGPLAPTLLHTYGLDSQHIFHDCSKMERYFKEFHVMRKEGASENSIALLLHEFIQELCSNQSVNGNFKISKRVARLKIDLDKHVERVLSMTELAERHGLSKTYMIRIFKEEVDTSPYEYLMRKRLETAKILLIHSSLLIKEISETLRFSDQYHFSNYFKRRTGISPKKFRNAGLHKQDKKEVSSAEITGCV